MSDTRTITMHWTGGLRFEGRRDGGPVFLFDGDAQAGPSPVDALLGAAAACSGIDVVSILEKMREPFTAVEVQAEGTRSAEHPKRITHLTLTYLVTGTGLDAAKVRRAAELSVEKYCSVLQTFSKETVLVWRTELRTP